MEGTATGAAEELKADRDVALQWWRLKMVQFLNWPQGK
eukprot:COSAG01_NODE_1695_length_9464_cov_4.884677_12_plen_38_part_00